MSIKVEQLRDAHLSDAAELVSNRYKALRVKIPILPVRYENVDSCVCLLGELFQKQDGIVAIIGSKMVGFMLGLQVSGLFGKRAMYSPDWANGAELGDSQRIYEEMYTILSRRWVDEGFLIHAMSTLSHDQPGNEAWRWLGFGLSAVDGVRELKPVTTNNFNFKIRQADLKDLGIVTTMDCALKEHLAEAPTFWIHELEDYNEWMQEIGNLVWLGYHNGEAVGFMALEPGENCECAFLREEKTINISGAYTLEGKRGQGIATAILNRALRWAQEEGYERCSVDFEAINTLASHFWMRWFEPVSYSWIRWIDERSRR